MEEQLRKIKKIVALKKLVDGIDVEEYINGPALVDSVVKEAKEIIND